MPQFAASQHISESDYFELEAKSPLKHEYFRGEVVELPGCSYNHSLITTNLGAHLGNMLRDRGAVAISNLRIKVEASGFMAYPDVTVVFGKPQLNSEPLDTLLNPTLIVEVLSPSTEHYDRTFKFDHYKRISSLNTFLVVSQFAPFIDQYVREGDSWIHTGSSSIEGSLHLPGLNISLSLSEIYSGVDFDSNAGGLTLPFRS